MVKIFYVNMLINKLWVYNRILDFTIPKFNNIDENLVSPYWKELFVIRLYVK